MDLQQAIRSRRSVRKFLDRPIEDSILLQILDAGRWAPSACNEQLWQFIVIRNNDIKAKLVKEAGTASLVSRAPIVLAVYYYREFFPENIASASISVQNILLAATEAGVGSLWVGAVGDRRKINSILGVPQKYYLVCFVLLGFSAEEVKPIPPRRPLSEIVHFDYYGAAKAPNFSHDPEKWSIQDIAQYQRYYCRKTSLGRQMMVAHPREKGILKHKLMSKGRCRYVVDLFSYDGSLLQYFPRESTIISLELSDQTSHYIKRATNRNVNPIVFNGISIPLREHTVPFASILLKMERIPPDSRLRLFDELFRVLSDDGVILVAYRNMFSLYGIFYYILRLFRGDNIRRTVLFSFFGPYKPVTGSVKSQIKKVGFQILEERYFFVPPVFREYYELFRYFLFSKGTTFLHREERPPSPISVLLQKLLHRLGSRRSFLGSFSVLTIRKRGH